MMLVGGLPVQRRTTTCRTILITLITGLRYLLSRQFGLMSASSRAWNGSHSRAVLSWAFWSLLIERYAYNSLLVYSKIIEEHASTLDSTNAT